MGILKRLTGKLHICRFKKLIVSMYWTFDDRKVIRECFCGKRIILKEDFSTQVYPHETGHFEHTGELKIYLTQSPLRNTFEYKFHKFNL